MDFTKLVALLHDQALYFCRLDKLSDPFEGSYPIANHRLFEGLASKIGAGLEGLSELDRAARIEECGKIGKRVSKSVSKSMFVSCWHKNDYESAAMWKLYLKSNEGIALRTTSKRFADSFQVSGCAVNIGEVKYIDYENGLVSNSSGGMNTFDPAVHKRISFAHENEVRALRWNTKPYLVLDDGDDEPIGRLDYDLEGPMGEMVKVDLPCLIESIYVSPTSPTWLLNLVKQVTHKYGIDVDVCQSSLDNSPIF